MRDWNIYFHGMSNVTKKDLVETISDKTGLTQVDSRIVVESFLAAISTSLRQGKNIEIRGFGRFTQGEQGSGGKESKDGRGDPCRGWDQTDLCSVEGIDSKGGSGK
jgi:nucleoid DNA-binding protein